MGTVTNISRTKFSIGEIIQHKFFDFRGVIYGIDSKFQSSDEWHLPVARLRPLRNNPWYHVLIHDTGKTTYVAERNIEGGGDKGPINHPLVGRYFIGFDDGHYLLNRKRKT